MSLKKKRKKINKGTFLFLFVTGLCLTYLIPAVSMGESPSSREQGEKSATVKRADPFQPFIEILTEKELKAKETQGRAAVPLTPLERYGIEEFKLVGVSESRSKHMAIVEDSQGKCYSLYLGTRIGMNNGIVRSITGDRVVVVESQRDMSGKLVSREVVLKFESQEAGE